MSSDHEAGGGSFDDDRGTFDVDRDGHPSQHPSLPPRAVRDNLSEE